MLKASVRPTDMHFEKSIHVEFQDFSRKYAPHEHTTMGKLTREIIDAASLSYWTCLIRSLGLTSTLPVSVSRSKSMNASRQQKQQQQQQQHSSSSRNASFSSKKSTTKGAKGSAFSAFSSSSSSSGKNDHKQKTPPTLSNNAGTTHSGVIKKSVPVEWTCASCTFVNAKSSHVCEMCDKSRKGGTGAALKSGGHQCPQCTLVNDKGVMTCNACGHNLLGSPTYI